MDQIWKTVLAIIGSVGGAGLIIAFIGKWLAQLIADRVIQSKQQQFERELTEIRANFDLALEQYRTKAAEYTYVSQLQFETEFKVYQSLFFSLHEFSVCTEKLFPRFEEIPADPEEAKQFYVERYNRFCPAYNSFAAVLEQNAPFIPKHIYDAFKSLQRMADAISCMYIDIKLNSDPRLKEDYAEISQDNRKKTREFRDNLAKLKDDVRDYLGTLRIQN